MTMQTPDLSALWREDATEDEGIAAYQYMIDDGSVWSMDGSTGRCAMSMIEAGACVLGPTAHRDYWGNRIPGRFEAKDGTKGSISYAHKLHIGELGHGASTTGRCSKCKALRAER